jgi:hypothetical protein
MIVVPADVTDDAAGAASGCRGVYAAAVAIQRQLPNENWSMFFNIFDLSGSFYLGELQ